MPDNSDKQSLRDTISDAYDTVTANETPQEEGVKEAVIPGPEVKTETTEKPGRTAGRARDESGRLLPGKAEKKEEVAPPVEAAPAKPRPPRPSSWKKEMWEHYEKLDPTVAEYIVQRENEFAKGVSTYKNEWDQVQPIAKAMAEFAPLLQQHNIKPEQWISNLGNAHKTLALGTPEQKLSAFMKLAGDYQIPVQNLFVQGQDGKVYFNPQVQPYQAPQPAQAPVEDVVKKILLEQSTAQEISNFAAATDDKGQPKHPHFEAVRATMQGLLQAELATDLADAYKQALMHPRHSDIAASIREQEQKAEAERKAEEQRQAVARARQKVISPRTSTPTVTETGKPKGVRAAVEAAVEQHLGGGRV